MVLTMASGCIAAAHMVILGGIMQLMISLAICNTICFALSILCACACGLAIHLNLLAVTRGLVLVRDDAVLVRNFAPEPVRAHMLSTLRAGRTA